MMPARQPGKGECVYAVIREYDKKFSGQIFSTKRRAMKFIDNELFMETWIVLKVQIDEYNGVDDFHFVEDS